MPVFDFNNAPDDKKPVVCTYTTFSSNEDHASIENPILVLDNSKRSGITIPVGFSRIRVSRLLLNLMKTEER